MRRSLLAGIASLPRLVILACMLSIPCSLLSRGGAAEPSSEKQIERWIEELGSARFEVREAATLALMEREEAVAALHKALISSDAEVRRRAARILEALKPKRARRALARADALGKEGRIVEVVDRLVYWRECDRDKGWDSLTKFVLKATDKAGPYYPSSVRVCRDSRFPAGDFQRYAELVQPKQFSARKIDLDLSLKPRNRQEVADRIALLRDKRLFRAEEISIRGQKQNPVFYDSIITAPGDIQLPCAHTSVIIAGGDIKLFGLQPYNLVVCDGDVELQWPEADKNVIVVRGKVTCPQGKITKCLIYSGHTLRLPDGKTVDFKDGTPDPFAFVKFFELADVGITPEDLPLREKSDVQGVLLKKVRKDSPFTKGLRAGDRITAIEGKKTPTSEILRRTLRRKLAEDKPTITFTVGRSGKAVDVPISMKD